MLIFSGAGVALPFASRSTRLQPPLEAMVAECASSVTCHRERPHVFGECVTHANYPSMLHPTAIILKPHQGLPVRYELSWLSNPLRHDNYGFVLTSHVCLYSFLLSSPWAPPPGKLGRSVSPKHVTCFHTSLPLHHLKHPSPLLLRPLPILQGASPTLSSPPLPLGLPYPRPVALQLERLAAALGVSDAEGFGGGPRTCIPR